MSCCDNPKPYKLAYYEIRRKLYLEGEDIVDWEDVEEHHSETLPEIYCDNCGADLGGVEGKL